MYVCSQQYTLQCQISHASWLYHLALRLPCSCLSFLYTDFLVALWWIHAIQSGTSSTVLSIPEHGQQCWALWSSWVHATCLLTKKYRVCMFFCTSFYLGLEKSDKQLSLYSKLVALRKHTFFFFFSHPTNAYRLTTYSI